MQVAMYNESEYFNNIRKFLNYGGKHAQAAKAAAGLVQKIQADVPMQSKTTNHGESRIKGCTKYSLGNGFRLVTVWKGEVVFLLYIGSHDETENWLNNNAGLTVTVGKDNKQAAFTIINRPEPWRVEATTAVTLSNTPFLNRLSDVDWKTLIPINSIRLILTKFDEDSNDDDLLVVLEELAQTHRDEAELCLTVINHLKNGEREAAQAAVDVFHKRAKPITEEDTLTIDVLRSEPNQGRFIILNDLTEDELKLFHDPIKFREWMVCLHSGQKRVVDEDFDNPCLLTGVSGSGKTCVLVHRAKRLAQKYPDEKILILTLNHNLAGLIEILIGDLCSKHELERITVRPFYEYLTEMMGELKIDSFLHSLGQYTNTYREVDNFLRNTPDEDRAKIFKPLSNQEQLIAFKRFLAEPNNPAKTEYDRLEVYVFGQDQNINLRQYLFEELELVRSAFTCYDEYKGYKDYTRVGRSITFFEKRRQAVLMILKEWERYQLKHGFLDMMGLTQATIFGVDEKGGIPIGSRYRAVLVDEFQDFSTLELSLLKKIPTGSTNGLFLTGDFAQKIYPKDLNMTAAQLGKDNRTDRMIRKNYRNSRQILQAANDLLTTYPPPLADGEEDVKIHDPEYAHKESALPIATKAPNPIQAAWQFAVEWLEGGHIPFSVCIATASPNSFSTDTIIKQKAGSVNANVLTGDYMLNPNSVVVSDISAVKGFEFSLIIILGLDEDEFPPAGVPVDEHWREALRLYVAITRGRDEVRFIYSNKPSPFINAMGERIQFQSWDPPSVIDTIKPEPAKEPSSEDNSSMRHPSPTDPEIHESKGRHKRSKKTLIEFVNSHKKTELNGVLIVPIPEHPTSLELAALLAQSESEVNLVCQQQNYFASPDSKLPDHIVLGVCKYFRCTPNIVRQNPQ